MGTFQQINNFGSLCSGIEAASFVLLPMGLKPSWYSEIAPFPSLFLSKKYPETTNVGDMCEIPSMIRSGEIMAPDLICGGTPCQAFSFAGWKNGLNDDRGQLTLRFIDVLNESDSIRSKESKQKTIFLWENVEGVLSDKTNAFGCFIGGLAGLEEPLSVKKWTNGGICYGVDRNIAWRVLDSKYFGVPQQRRRIYVIGGGKDFHPENILFEQGDIFEDPFRIKAERSLFDIGEEPIILSKDMEGTHFEVFRSYSDCVYTAYGTKWNGNAAAFNGSLFVAQDDRVRRLTPVECERLMGFPDNYTLLDKCTITQRYQAIGNSWAVPVVSWLFNRIMSYQKLDDNKPSIKPAICGKGVSLYLLSDFTPNENCYINASSRCYDYKKSSMLDIVEKNDNAALFLSPAACSGILRRKETLKAKINNRLELLLRKGSTHS